MHWPSFLTGVAVLPALAVAAGLLVLLSHRGSVRSVKCDACDWRFAGLADNHGRLGEPDQQLYRPVWIRARVSEGWHDQVLTRSRVHRAAWTANFESLAPGGSLHQRMLPMAPRYGVRGRDHDHSAS